MSLKSERTNERTVALSSAFWQHYAKLFQTAAKESEFPSSNALGLLVCVKHAEKWHSPLDH